MQVWCRSLASGCAQVPAQIQRDLSDEGIRALDVASPPAGHPGLIYLEAVDADVLHDVREISSSGVRRVLGVCSARLPDAEIWALLANGMADVLFWSPGAGAAAAARLRRWRDVDALVSSRAVAATLIGGSPAWIALLRTVVEIAAFTDAPVLIVGETGTGKELLARLIHTLDRRRATRELILLDCTTIVPELSGSEFFGHERGAYTGAVGARDGAFALASGGTLFLDEVGELDSRLQGQILRVIQEGTYKPVGGNTWRKADFRLVSATSRDLRAEVERASFRGDLYHRLAACICRTIPLARRREDIVPLARHFVRTASAPREPPAIDEALERYLIQREYPGNVRDLRQLVTRLLAHYPGAGPLTLACLPAEERQDRPGETVTWKDDTFEAAIRKACAMGASLKAIGRAAEDTAVRIALTDCDGRLSLAAERLGVTDRALQLRRAAARALADPPRAES